MTVSQGLSVQGRGDHTIKARAQAGRLVVDEPTDLPERPESCAEPARGVPRRAGPAAVWTRNRSRLPSVPP